MSGCSSVNQNLCPDMIHTLVRLCSLFHWQDQKQVSAEAVARLPIAAEQQEQFNLPRCEIPEQIYLSCEDSRLLIPKRENHAFGN